MTNRDEIENTLARFMNCFDLKDWASMAALLEPTISVDYSDLRGDTPTDVASVDYVRARSDALQDLSTHHQLTNLEIAPADGVASVSASCMIYRRQGERFFNSHAFYRFRLAVADGAWRISAISQRILWNEGDPRIHKGAAGRRT
jgi:hypothetical protein